MDCVQNNLFPVVKSTLHDKHLSMVLYSDCSMEPELGTLSAQDQQAGYAHAQTLRPYAEPGSSVACKLVVQASKDYTLEGISVIFKATEKCSWTEGVGDGRKTYSNRVSIVNPMYCLRLLGPLSLSAGEHSYPFTLSIPAGAPPSTLRAGSKDAFPYPRATAYIRYSLTAEVSLPGTLMSSKVVVETRIPVARLYRGPAQPGPEKPLYEERMELIPSGCCSTGGVARLALWVERPVVPLGGQFPLLCHGTAVHGRAGETVPGIQFVEVTIKRVIKLKSSGFRTETFKETLFTKKYTVTGDGTDPAKLSAAGVVVYPPGGAMPAGRPPIMLPIQATIKPGQELVMPSLTSKAIEVAYILSLGVEAPALCPAEASMSIPLTVAMYHPEYAAAAGQGGQAAQVQPAFLSSGVL